MSICVISFTQKGAELSQKLAETCFQEHIRLFTKCSTQKEKNPDVTFVEHALSDWTKEQMKKRNTLIFIGACGIAVRAIAPYITDKMYDSAVLVMDEKGNYIIPILSGHMGGANEIAERIAEKMESIPVITTATDVQRVFAVDLFAKKNGLYIMNKEGIANISAKVLAGENITVKLDEGHICSKTKMPQKISLTDKTFRQKPDIWISTDAEETQAVLALRPREYIIGMGCKRGKEAEQISQWIMEVLTACGICVNQIFAFASIDKKKEEEGFLAWCEKENIPFLTYDAVSLSSLQGEFTASGFVKEQVGVDNVCERAAWMASGQRGTFLLRKCCKDGMTIAIVKREWSVSFDE